MDTDTDPSERTWQERFRTALEPLDLGTYDVREDVARGRRRVRRSRLAIGSAVVVTAAVAVAGGLAFRTGGSPSGDSAGHFAGSTTTTTATTAPPLSPQQLAAEDAARAEAQLHWQKNLRLVGPDSATTSHFRDHLYDLAADHLDPSKKYLNYDTDSLQTTTGAGTGISLGIKLGWVVPGRPGEGEVQVSVSSLTGGDAIPCGFDSGVTCTPVTMPDGNSALYGEKADGTFEVSYKQPDGETVDVVVDPLFGNDSTTPVHAMSITRQQVYGLVQDGRINLPTDPSH